MSLCLKEVDVKNIIFIADKGFYSADNIKLLDDQGLHYLIPLRRNNPVIDYNLIADGELKKTNRFFMYQKRAVWYYQYIINDKQYITFLDERLRVEEEEDYLQRMTTQPEEYTQEKYIEKLYPFGTMTLVYKTGVPHTPEQLYSADKQRNEIEIMFYSYKTFLKADVTYIQNRHDLEGRLFSNFIARKSLLQIIRPPAESGTFEKRIPERYYRACQSGLPV
jgi:transposase